MIKKVSIKEVAKKAGVSVATISYVLNGTGKSKRITESTIKKSQDAIDELGYIPNVSAINLRSGKTKTIAVVLPDLSSYFFAMILKGIESYATKENYKVIVYQSAECVEREKKIFGELIHTTAEGVLFSASLGNKNQCNHVASLNKIMPVIGFDRVLEGLDVPHVISDDYQAGYKAGKYLLVKGCKRLFFLGVDTTVSVFKLRYEGFKKAIEELGNKNVQVTEVMCKCDEESQLIIEKAIDVEFEHDGVFSCNERYTIQLLQKMLSLNERVTNNSIPIVSFYNYPDVDLLTPKIKSIRQQPFEMGEKACSLLINKLQQRGEIIKEMNMPIVIPCGYDF